jgi:hypothetical protein
LPKINLSKIGSAAVAAATGTIMLVAPVFAQTTPAAPQPGTGSVITVIIDTMTFKFELSAQAAAELAAKLAAKQAELAAEAAATPAAPEVDEDVEEELDVDEDTDHQPTATTVTATTKIVKIAAATAGAEHEGND